MPDFASESRDDGAVTDWGAVVALVEPQGHVLSVRELPGGLANHSTLIEVGGVNETTHRLVVRRGRAGRAVTGLQISQEFELLIGLHGRGLPVPAPRWSGRRSFGEAVQDYAVLDFVEGAMLLSSDDPSRVGQAVADRLVGIHQTDVASLSAVPLPATAAAVGRLLAAPVGVHRDLSGGERVRAVLAAYGSDWFGGGSHLVHGDFWPGNHLWRDGEFVATIDWQAASLGNPLWDLAIARLDLWWTYGREATNSLTDRYVAESRHFFDQPGEPGTGGVREALPLWDLAASLRPVGNLQIWADDWAQLGRPDLTANLMAEVHGQFVQQAIELL